MDRGASEGMTGSPRRSLRALGGLFVVCAALTGCAGSSRGGPEQTGYEEKGFDDSILSAQVRAALDAEPRLRASFIEVDASQGIVRLSGFADSRQEAEQAVQTARRVLGVMAVRDRLVVRRGSIAR